ncbi:hypothetical protein B0H67DRAFT_555982 [Lasiosphaeris hirsuta]|uniref:Uncharacterized protein n=1 Tax=Lasiosphaeris hirsuta TaxID=260670 RepID=A0AA40AAF1_9PEZI|nr:hypothetical protein B0H67DRAFT_555982 [Lasiosphaeris hirsuta]
MVGRQSHSQTTTAHPMAAEVVSTQPRASWPCAGTPHHYCSNSISSAAASGTIPEQDECWDRGQRRAENELKIIPNTITTVETPPLTLQRDIWTRNLAIVELILAWAAAIATLATGIIMLVSPNVNVPDYLLGKAVMVGPTPYTWIKVSRYPGGHRIYKVSEFTMVALPLILQMLITVISGCFESIHSTTLRWALWHEGRLRYNSNLRLFTSSKRNGPNKWPANVVALIGLVLVYGGASVMIFPVSVTAIVTSTGPDGLQLDYNVDAIEVRNGIDFNGWGLAGLGAGLLLQSIISTWALLDSAYVGTWNGNPLATARACKILHDTMRDPHESTTSLSHSYSDMELLPSPHQPHPQLKPSLPVFTQPPALSLLPTTRTFTNLLWATFTFLALTTLTVALLASRPSATRSSRGASTSLLFVQRFAGHSSPWYIFQFFGIVEAVYNRNPYGTRMEYVGLLIQCAALCIPMFGLHVAELLSQMQRDETIWRRAAGEGVDPDSSLILQGARNWESWVVFLSKSVVPWIFGFAVSCNRNIYFATLPMVAVATVFLALGLFAEYLIRVRPKGSQPATYGNVLALVELVDDWGHERVFWGDKGVYEGEVRRAGTAGRMLGDVREGVSPLYKCPRVITDIPSNLPSNLLSNLNLP